MAITCKIHTTELDDNAVVITDFAYQTAQLKTSRTIAGDFVVQSFDRSAYGERITLSNLWLTRTTLNTIATLANDSDATYTLTLPNGTTQTVMFNNANGTIPIKASSLLPDAQRANTEKFNVVLEFLRVA